MLLNQSVCYGKKQVCITFRQNLVITSDNLAKGRKIFQQLHSMSYIIQCYESR